MKNLLLIKHWQLFILFVGIQLILQILMIAHLIEPFHFVMYQPVATIISAMIFFAWILALGSKLQAKIPISYKTKISFFKFSVVAIFAYLILLSFFFIFIGFPSSLAFQFIHLFTLVLIVYCLGFVAMSLKTYELKRIATVSDYFSEALLIFFFPLGIWIIQPKINKIFASEIS